MIREGKAIKKYIYIFQTDISAIMNFYWSQSQEFQIKISGHFQDISGQKFCFSRTISSSGKPKYEHVFRNTL